jgi:predicted nucleic acid-binding protein
VRYLDANVLLAAAFEQSVSEHARANRVMDSLRSQRQEVFVTEPVLAEVAANLRTARLGRQSHSDIAGFLSDVVSLPAVALADKSIWPRTLELLGTYRIDLADAHQIALLERDTQGEVISFDRRYKDFRQIKWTEP